MSQPDARPRTYLFGPFLIDTREGLLWRDGTPVPLTPKAFATLVALVEQSGHVVSKDELLRQVWPDSFVEENNLSQNI
ncbi:MAG: winged helix-turn-helix domain-containing protein [Acidobacteriota bacterium]|nr:winged helix-turn-helix domain-containing protein [Acidobacteriota bacterium]